MLKIIMHLKDLIHRFNASNFVAYCCLLVFTVLLSLRVDGIVTWNYAAIFIPLWLWNALVLTGLIVGVAFWVKKRRLRQDPEHVHHFKALLLSAALQFPVFLAELLVVINIETGQHQWRVIFTPLYFLTGASIAPCVWACWRKRSVDLEVLAMANLLQLVFLGIQLDGVVSWSWAVVFIPTWLLLCLSAIAVGLRACVLVILYKIGENQQELDQKRPIDILSVLCSCMVICLLVVFAALLTSQLDGRISAPFAATFIPLHLAILTLMASTITRTPGNPWWFGIRRNFVDFVLDKCPVLQEYVNVSYSPEDPEEEAATEDGHSKLRTVPSTVVWTPGPEIYPYEDIYTPD